MEYRTVATKLPNDELTMFRTYCQKKGVSPSSLVRELILNEMKITVPHTVAGRNKIRYEKEKDTFVWAIKLDDGREIDVLRDISPCFVEDLYEMMTLRLGDRTAFINKRKSDSVPIPGSMVK